MIDAIISVLFPTYCCICKQEGEAICNRCIRDLPNAFETPFPYITSLFLFKDKNVKRCIHVSKYNNRRDVLKIFAKILSQKLKEEPSTTVLIPIPMPLTRKYMRGYNHTDVIVKEISKITNLKSSTNTLIRKKNAKRQVETQSRNERLKNQRNVFKVIGNVQDCTFIIVDDVTTTGSTIKAAREVLLRCGAKEVRAYTIAH